MNKLVDFEIGAEQENENRAQAASAKTFWSDSYERRLQALFEAIVAEGIEARPTLDEGKNLAAIKH